MHFWGRNPAEPLPLLHLQHETQWANSTPYCPGEEEVIDELCYYSKNFNVVMADYALLVGRTVTSEEKKLIKEKLNKKNAHKNK